MAKGLFGIIFVVAAGIFYLCAVKKSGEGNGVEVVLQSEEGTQNGGMGGLRDTADRQKTGNLGEIAEVGKIVNQGKSEDTKEIQSGEMVYVHVCGAVNKPGVYALPAGSRTADAVICAGDFAPKAARDYLNLAKQVVDGQKIYVPDKEEAARFLEEGTLPGAGSSEETLFGEGTVKNEVQKEDTAYVDINVAGAEELMTLPGIGKAKADAILAYRKEHGAFSSCEELMQVPGIKESIYQKFCDRIQCNRKTVEK